MSADAVCQFVTMVVTLDILYAASYSTRMKLTPHIYIPQFSSLLTLIQSLLNVG